MLSIDMVKCFNTTITGARHIDIGKECQDASLTWHSDEENVTIAVVSDGHGGERYVNSARGSVLACQTALEVLQELVRDEHFSLTEITRPEAMRHLSSCIVTRWRTSVDAERGEQELQTYGCTLIAYVQKGREWLALQIGDGSFVVQTEEGQWSRPIPWDDRCFLNMTTSMCDELAAGEFRFASSLESGVAKSVWLTTDGLDNTFEDKDLCTLYQHLQDDICDETKGLESIRLLMPKILDYYSLIGIGDDMSVACVMNEED